MLNGGDVGVGLGEPGQGLKLEAVNQLRPPLWLAGAQAVKPMLLPPRVNLDGKVRSAALLALGPRHSDRGCGHPS